jgi:hypothetical protein
MPKRPPDKPDAEPLRIEPPKTRKPLPPPERTLKDRKKEAQRRKAREKSNPGKNRTDRFGASLA